MKNIILAVLMVISFSLFAQNSMNMILMGTYEWPNTEGSDIWGWVDANGNEFALVGLRNGFSVVDVTNPIAPSEAFFIDIPCSAISKSFYLVVGLSRGSSKL